MWIKEKGAADKDGQSVSFDEAMARMNAGNAERMDSFGERGPDLPAAQTPAPGVEQSSEEIVDEANRVDEYRARGFDADGRSMREKEGEDRSKAEADAAAKNAADADAAASQRRAADQAAAAAAAKKASQAADAR